MEKIFEIQDDSNENEQEMPTMPRNNQFVSPDLDVNDLGIDMLMNDRSKKSHDELSAASEESKLFESEEDEDDEEKSEEDEQNDNNNNNSYRGYTHSNNGAGNGFGSYSYRDPQAEKKEKAEMLYQFDRLEKKGFKLPRKFTMESSLDEMKTEFELKKR